MNNLLLHNIINSAASLLIILEEQITPHYQIYFEVKSFMKLEIMSKTLQINWHSSQNLNVQYWKLIKYDVQAVRTQWNDNLS